LGAVVALAIAAPAFAGDLTSIEVDPSGKVAIAVKKVRAPVHGDLGFRLEGTTVSGG
jgi:hypothetical protein